MFHKQQRKEEDLNLNLINLFHEKDLNESLSWSLPHYDGNR